MSVIDGCFGSIRPNFEREMKRKKNKEKEERGGKEMRILVKFFASIRDICRISELEVDLDKKDQIEPCLDQLMEYLIDKFPKLKNELSSLSIALNTKYVTNNVYFRDGDEIALLPPISGG